MTPENKEYLLKDLREARRLTLGTTTDIAKAINKLSDVLEIVLDYL